MTIFGVCRLTLCALSSWILYNVIKNVYFITELGRNKAILYSLYNVIQVMSISTALLCYER